MGRSASHSSRSSRLQRMILDDTFHENGEIPLVDGSRKLRKLRHITQSRGLRPVGRHPGGGRIRRAEEGGAVGRRQEAILRRRGQAPEGYPKLPDAQRPPGAFLTDTSSLGHAFLDRRLFLPEEWTKDPARCREAKVPESVTFASKPQLAQAMLEYAFALGIPAAWVTGDEGYGGVPALRTPLERRPCAYVPALRSNEPLTVPPPLPKPRLFGLLETAASATAKFHPEAWARHSAGAGSKGERWYDWAWLPLAETTPAGWRKWRRGGKSAPGRPLRSPSTPHWWRSACRKPAASWRWPCRGPSVPASIGSIGRSGDDATKPALVAATTAASATHSPRRPPSLICGCSTRRRWESRPLAICPDGGSHHCRGIAALFDCAPCRPGCGPRSRTDPRPRQPRGTHAAARLLRSAVYAKANDQATADMRISLLSWMTSFASNSLASRSGPSAHAR